MRYVLKVKKKQKTQNKFSQCDTVCRPFLDILLILTITATVEQAGHVLLTRV